MESNRWVINAEMILVNKLLTITIGHTQHIVPTLHANVGNAPKRKGVEKTM